MQLNQTQSQALQNIQDQQSQILTALLPLLPLLQAVPLHIDCAKNDLKETLRAHLQESPPNNPSQKRKHRPSSSSDYRVTKRARLEAGNQLPSPSRSHETSTDTSTRKEVAVDYQNQTSSRHVTPRSDTNANIPRSHHSRSSKSTPSAHHIQPHFKTPLRPLPSRIKSLSSSAKVMATASSRARPQTPVINTSMTCLPPSIEQYTDDGTTRSLLLLQNTAPPTLHPAELQSNTLLQARNQPPEPFITQPTRMVSSNVRAG